jgi:hypothetical protein
MYKLKTKYWFQFQSITQMEPPSEIWSLWVNKSETTAYTARDNEVIVADLSPKVKLLKI